MLRRTVKLAVDLIRVTYEKADDTSIFGQPLITATCDALCKQLMRAKEVEVREAAIHAVVALHRKGLDEPVTQPIMLALGDEKTGIPATMKKLKEALGAFDASYNDDDTEPVPLE